MCTGTRNDTSISLSHLDCLFGFSLFVVGGVRAHTPIGWFSCLVVYCRGVEFRTPIGWFSCLVVCCWWSQSSHTDWFVWLFIVVESNFAHRLVGLVACSFWAIDTLGTLSTPVFLVQTIQTHSPIQLGVAQRGWVCHCSCC